MQRFKGKLLRDDDDQAASPPHVILHQYGVFAAPYWAHRGVSVGFSTLQIRFDGRFDQSATFQTGYLLLLGGKVAAVQVDRKHEQETIPLQLKFLVFLFLFRAGNATFSLFYFQCT